MSVTHRTFDNNLTNKPVVISTLGNILLNTKYFLESSLSWRNFVRPVWRTGAKFTHQQFLLVAEIPQCHTLEQHWSLFFHSETPPSPFLHIGTQLYKRGWVHQCKEYSWLPHLPYPKWDVILYFHSQSTINTLTYIRSSYMIYEPPWETISRR